jgi:ribosomal protein S14
MGSRSIRLGLMKYKIIKDSNIRQKVYETEENRLVIKFLYVNLLNNKSLKELTKKKLAKYLTKRLNSNISKTRVVRRCVLNGRARVSNRILGISRIKLRDMLKNEIFPGFSKAIW